MRVFHEVFYFFIADYQNLSLTNWKFRGNNYLGCGQLINTDFGRTGNI